MTSSRLLAQQEALADDALASYEFGDGLTVIDSDNWAQDTFDGKDDWNKVVYVECDDDAPDADAHKVSFHVAFVEGTLTIDEAYAYWCENGAEIGFMGQASVMSIA